MLLRISCTHISLPDLGGSKTKVQAGLAYMTKDLRKMFNDHLDAKLDSHTPLYLRSVGKRWYSEGGVCPRSSGRECDRMSTLQYMYMYVKGLHEATQYLSH